jgi:serine palmitoyltransferase
MSDTPENIPELIVDDASGIGSFITFKAVSFLLILLGISVLVYLHLQKKKKPKKIVEISDEEVENLVKNWTPQPLHQELTELQKLNSKVPLIQSAPAAYVKVNDKLALNLATSNYLGLVQEEHIQQSAEKALRKYGCGSCGPRGFYGTIDIHLQLEDRLAQFMGTENAVIYSSAFATMASAIPAFSKSGDIIIADSAVHFAFKTGMNLSRSTIKLFKHNDMEDLERILEEVVAEHKKSKKKLTRRFLVVEGVYQNTGSLLPLPHIMKLKEKYCFRIFLDDSNGFGVLGQSGRGICEHFGIPPKDIEFILSSMGNSLGSTGGFCCGSKQITSHQRLNSSGYVFSASLPPYLAATALASLDKIESEPERIAKVRHNANLFRETLGSFDNGLIVCGEKDSPLTHIKYPLKGEHERFSVETQLQKLVDEAFTKHDIALTRAKYLESETNLPHPSIIVMVSSSHQEEDIVRAATLIKQLGSKIVF